MNNIAQKKDEDLNNRVRSRREQTSNGMTKLGQHRIHLVRCRGGMIKHRALRLDSGNFSWGSESIAKKTRIIDTVYNPCNNELVRTKTLVKNAIVVIDAAPFRQW